jgi:hypothetical protein
VVGDGASLTAHYLASAAKTDQRTNPAGKAAPSRVKCVTCPAFSAWGGWGGAGAQGSWRCSHSDTVSHWLLSPVTHSDRVKLVEQKSNETDQPCGLRPDVSLGTRRPEQS